MSNRFTLEGDRTIPEDFQVVRVLGKFLPREELNGELSGDFFVERIDGFSPRMSQLAGPEEASQSHFFGSFIHDDAIPLSLSGDELGAWGALLRAFKFKAPAIRMPAFRGFKVNTKGLSRGIGNETKSVGKVGKQIGKGAQNSVRSYGKAWKDVGKGLGNGLKDVGKIVGQVAEGGMGLLQSMGQGQGQEDPGTEEEQFEDQNQEGSEESPSEEPIDEFENLEELNGELGFLPQAMMAAGTAGQMFSAFNNMQQQNAQAKHARSMDKINAFSSILKPQASAKKKAVTSKANSSFSNPKLSKTQEGAYKLSYSSRDASGAGSNNPSENTADPNKDKNNMIYIGAAIAVVLVIVMMNKKGR
ncbi:hypothetical protein B1J93_17800 [Leptospira kirschneri serovar Pomona]|uniref:Uncharacterized protein n=1 Tax=Leptospira kirschneri serovar Pomona TaxID=561005 RepID=A0A1T1DHJ7_9LEPT|nr:hypothetical protein [Leptospira kirschneri]OOV40200.1 hypothetical protein B1J93_17800 [Leptospira kirschneri serovar Pomona]